MKLRRPDSARRQDAESQLNSGKSASSCETSHSAHDVSFSVTITVAKSLKSRNMTSGRVSACAAPAMALVSNPVPALAFEHGGQRSAGSHGHRVPGLMSSFGTVEVAQPAVWSMTP